MAITFETLKFNNLAQGRLCLSAKRQSAVRPQILKSSNRQILKSSGPQTSISNFRSHSN